MGYSCHGVSLFHEMLSITREVGDFQCGTSLKGTTSPTVKSSL